MEEKEIADKKEIAKFVFVFMLAEFFLLVIYCIQ